MNVPRPSGTWQTPSRAIFSGDMPTSSLPWKRIEPLDPAERAADRPQQRRLAGAVGAEHGDHLALLDAEVDAVQHLDEPVAAVEVARPRARSFATSQVGVDHGLVVARPSAGVALGDRAAEVEHRDVVAQPHDEAHVVLDEHDREVVVARGAGARAPSARRPRRGPGRRRARRAAAASARRRSPGRARPASACRRAARRPGRPATVASPTSSRAASARRRTSRSSRSTQGARTALLTQSDLRTRCRPTITFSRTVRRGNRARFWNVREMRWLGDLVAAACRAAPRPASGCCPTGPGRCR